MPRKPNTTPGPDKKLTSFSTKFDTSLHTDLAILAAEHGLDLAQFIRFNLRQDVLEYKAGKRTLQIQPKKD